MKPLLEEELAANDRQMEDNQQVFVAFARVFSGVVRRGQTLYVLGPKHDPCKVIDSVSLLSLCMLNQSGVQRVFSTVRADCQ